MHPIQAKILKLLDKKIISSLSLRDIARLIGLKDVSPQKIKHHLLQLEKKGFIMTDSNKNIIKRVQFKPSLASGLLSRKAKLFSIPIVGTANCGPATIFAEENFQGFLKLSSRLIHRQRPNGLFAIKADGSSMNRAEINNKKIEDGDFLIIDKDDLDVTTNDIVLTIIDNKATVKRFIDDRKNGQIVLKADSSFDYEPIYLHPEDDFSINGKVIQVIKKQ